MILPSCDSITSKPIRSRIMSGSLVVLLLIANACVESKSISKPLVMWVGFIKNRHVIKHGDRLFVDLILGKIRRLSICNTLSL